MTCSECHRAPAAVLTFCGACALALFHGRFGVHARIHGEGADASASKVR